MKLVNNINLLITEAETLCIKLKRRLDDVQSKFDKTHRSQTTMRAAIGGRLKRFEDMHRRATTRLARRRQKSGANA